MKCYLLRDRENNVDFCQPCYVGTLGKVRAVIHGFDKVCRERIVVEEVEIDTSKIGVLIALNHRPITKVLRTWGITPRGGLKEFA